MTRTSFWVLLPLTCMALIFGLLIKTQPLALLTNMAPPTESLTVEQTVLDKDGITLFVRADGSEPMKIAQVQVDGAYWNFTQTPPGLISRLDKVRIDIPYPWISGEPHFIAFLTNTGTTFEHEIEVALASPEFSSTQFMGLTMLGILLGVVPVALGMLFYPALRKSGDRTFQFLLALTVGLLAFLFVDTFEEALDLAGEAAAGFNSGILVWLAATVTFATLFMIGRRRGTPSGTALSSYLSLGIGLHNLGEGLAVGVAFAIGETALGTFLIIGFVLHNITEGIGIVTPLIHSRPKLWVFAALAALAGLPAVIGVWIGAFAFAPQWASLFFAIGAGAILQVIVEVSAYLARRSRSSENSWISGASLSGFTAGLLVMYGTALFVTV